MAVLTDVLSGYGPPQLQSPIQPTQTECWREKLTPYEQADEALGSRIIAVLNELASDGFSLSPTDVARSEREVASIEDCLHVDVLAAAKEELRQQEFAELARDVVQFSRWFNSLSGGPDVMLQIVPVTIRQRILGRSFGRHLKATAFERGHITNMG